MSNNKKVHGRENDSVEVVDVVPVSEVAAREEAILAFWQEHDIFNKSLAQPGGSAPKGDFVFYDGPPFATGLPHYGHILAGTIKDAIPRFWTMNGYHVRRQWGWDCHGLPLENLIEKKLGLATKRDIEAYGVKNFNEAARAAVMEYADDWQRIIPRMGRWADMENDYKTMDSTYTESVWWVFKQLHEKGLVYEGFKSMHLCPRCGTTLSNFEVNQGYKDIKDIAVTVKLKLEPGQQIGDFVTDDNTSLLVWTTTPWTLPGNLAAAVHEEYEYVAVEVSKSVVAQNTTDGTYEKPTEISELKKEKVIVAKGRLQDVVNLSQDWVIHDESESFKGSELVGQRYEPPFPFLKKQEFEGKENAWQILHADYVELGEEGTGAVHLAPAYGEDDMVLAKAHGVPIVHHVDENGHFMPWVEGFECQLVKPKDDESIMKDFHMAADIEIVRALKASGKIFKSEKITHSYPHCWRCDTPLLNYATTSWFVKVTDIKEQLVAENDKVQWVPEHVGKNRFGKWLEGARDWAVSRQRYWGAPLPIWKNPETGEYKVFGSLKELQEYVPKSGNTYLLMRHGEAESNLTVRISAQKDGNDPLTERGVEQVAAATAGLKERGIDLIIHSGFMRTKATAEQVAAALGVAPEQVLEDERLAELQAGVHLEGKSWSDYQAQFTSEAASFTDTVPGSENRMDVVRRVGQVLYELEAEHKGKTILLVGHASSLFGLRAVAEGATIEEAITLKHNAGFLNNAEVLELPFTPLPHNDDFSLDFHRPYIDQIDLYDGDTKLERVPDVFDCWFESGSMPYGQHRYPFAMDEATFQKEHFPTNFIAYELDHTRGWFYSLIVLGTALFGKSPFENVIVNGLVLAEDGKKMSKSLQNYPDPMELANRVGVDAMRFYLLASPVIRGEDLNFSEKEVLELQRKNIGRLHNVLAMYEMFADGTEARGDSGNVLDEWIITRLNQLIAESTAGYKNYELDKATRPVTDFIDDLSVWYLRRSRDRLKGDDAADKTAALATLRFVLRELAKVMAPAMPFYAEYLYRAVRADDEPESVHLTSWPEGGAVLTTTLADMKFVRELVNEGLMLRSNKKINVRQPLALFEAWSDSEFQTEHVDALKRIIVNELNVKEVQLVTETLKSETKVDFDWTLTPEILAEGAVRELMRAVQGKRKELGLEPQDAIALTVATNEAGQAAVKAHEQLLTKTVGAAELTFAETAGEALETGTYRFTFTVQKQPS